MAGRLGSALGTRLEQDASEKIIKGTVAKLQGTDVFHLESAERTRRGGRRVGRDGGKRKKSQDRQERRSGVCREEDKRSGETRGRERE